MAGRKPIISAKKFAARTLINVRSSQREVAAQAASSRLCDRLNEVQDSGMLSDYVRNALYMLMNYEDAHGVDGTTLNLMIAGEPPSRKVQAAASVADAPARTQIEPSRSQLTEPETAKEEPGVVRVHEGEAKRERTRDEIIENALETIATAESEPKPRLRSKLLAM